MKEKFASQRNKPSAINFVLFGLIPYTKENLLLSFKPNLFFNELDKICDYSIPQLRRVYNRAKANGLILEDQGRILLSLEAKQMLQPLIAEKLPRSRQLIVTFDIPTTHNVVRQKLRRLLRHLKFEQIQKSVWASDYDYREIIKETVKDAKIERWVNAYVARKII